MLLSDFNTKKNLIIEEVLNKMTPEQQVEMAEELQNSIINSQRYKISQMERSLWKEQDILTGMSLKKELKHLSYGI